MSERDIADEDAAPRGYAEGSRVVALIEAALAEVRADERARCEEQSPWLRALAAEEARARAAEAERDDLRAEVERLRAELEGYRIELEATRRAARFDG